MNNRVTKLLDISYPIIQAGMIWCSGWELASAVSNAGGLGIIGSGSMYPDILREQIKKCKASTNKPFAVNVPLLYPNIEEHIKIILEEKVPIVFSSAGNPKTWTTILKAEGVKVIHVVSNVKFAFKAQEAGVDAIVAEGFEAGGHNGREETTTLCLIPLIKKNIHLPLIAAGGISSGAAMAAMFCLGAEGVQIGTRFVASNESSAHQNFKQALMKVKEGDTSLTLKEITPVRLIKNPFYHQIEEAYSKGASIDELTRILGKGRAKKGMFEGDMIEGELEIGQAASLVESIKPAAEIVNEIVREFNQTLNEMNELALFK
jgi:enoyl-[acyl-carrier protein] reductase II